MFNIAAALPFSIAPALGPVILAIGSGSYGVLYAFTGSAPSLERSPSCP